MTVEQTDTAIITAKSRNLGFEWTDEPREVWDFPDTSWMRLGPLGIQQEIEVAVNYSVTGELRSAFYVGGRRVIAVRLADGQDGKKNHHPFTDKWTQYSVTGPIISALRDGMALEVRLASAEG